MFKLIKQLYYSKLCGKRTNIKKVSEDYIYNLISRMTIREEVTSSEKSIRWHAYREAEKISDENVYPILAKIIEENHKNKETRSAAYTIIGYSLRKNFNKEACELLISKLGEETDKNVVSGILDRLACICIPEDIDMCLVIKCSQNDKWLIRHSAISALGSSATQANRDALLFYINQEDEKKYKYEITYANGALGQIGLKSDIPYLEKHIKSRKRDIRETAQYAIDRINERED